MIGIIVFARGLYEFIQKEKRAKIQKIIDVHEKLCANQIFRSITRKIHYQDNEEILKIDNDSKLAYLQALDTLIMYYQTKMRPKKETFELMGTLLITLWEAEPFWRNIEKDIWFQDLELMVEDMKKIKEKLVRE